MVTKIERVGESSPDTANYRISLERKPVSASEVTCERIMLAAVALDGLQHFNDPEARDIVDDFAQKTNRLLSPDGNHPSELRIAASTAIIPSHTAAFPSLIREDWQGDGTFSGFIRLSKLGQEVDDFAAVFCGNTDYGTRTYAYLPVRDIQSVGLSNSSFTAEK
jgi:hypothetical protein